MKSPKRSPIETASRRDAPGEPVPTAERLSRPRLPHERDAAADSQTPAPGPVSDIGAQAHEDYRESVKPAAPKKLPRR